MLPTPDWRGRVSGSTRSGEWNPGKRETQGSAEPFDFACRSDGKKRKRIKMKFGVAKFSLTVIKKQCTIIFILFAVSGNLLLRVSVAKEVFYGGVDR